jgi:hypothetical protein
VQQVLPQDAEAVLGQRVLDQNGKTIGRLIDVLVNAAGQPQAAVIDFGGFMGVGNRKIAVHWSALQFNPSDPEHKVVLDMTPDQIKAAPEYRHPDQAAPVVIPAVPASPTHNTGSPGASSQGASSQGASSQGASSQRASSPGAGPSAAQVHDTASGH